MTFAVISALFMMNMPIYASEFEGSEAEWLKKCSVAQSSEADAKRCREFKEYYAQQSNQLNQEIAAMKETSSQLSADLSNIRELIAQLDQQIADLDQQLAEAESNVTQMRTHIDELDQKMAEKQEQMDQLDKLVKGRMVKEQVKLGTNRYIDMLMGVGDLIDMLELLDGLQTITENDQEQMEQAAKLHHEYQLQQDEQKRLLETVEAQIAKNEEMKAAAESGRKEQKKLYAAFYQKEQEVKQAMENAQANASDMAGALAGIHTNVRDDLFQDSQEPGKDDNTNNSTGGNSSFIRPIAYALYAGTWYYPSDPWDTRLYEHIGADYSGPIGAPVVAPAKSIVLYANDPYGSAQYGPSLGWPRGGANTIELLTQVNGTTYAISFFHLAKGILVSPGDVVEQGQVVAYSGASGNVTGPHLHVELVNLGSMSITEAQAQFARNADFGWGSGWSVSSACSNRGYTPCRERPEEFFGY